MTAYKIIVALCFEFIVGGKEMIREELEKREEMWLSPYAAKSGNTAGRRIPLAPCPFRTEFQRDRDRIIHSKSFRRLKYKTQVFLPARGDHFRTRLTHTLEVSQIARTISRGLYLNEDLTEAIALGHDLGHTPFGHAGERVLDEMLRPKYHFRHNEQSLRIVDFLEKDGEGLNLTAEVRDGILNHTSKGNPQTLEGQVVSLADRIAYVNHDIDDALRSGLLAAEDLPHDFDAFLGVTHGSRINAMVADVIENSVGKDKVEMSSQGFEALSCLREFLFSHLYRLDVVAAEEKKSAHILEALFRYYRENSEDLPSYLREETPELRAGDYIAGMTDQYAVSCFKKIFIPQGFL